MNVDAEIFRECRRQYLSASKESTGVEVHSMLSRFAREPRRSSVREIMFQATIQDLKVKIEALTLEARLFHSSKEVG